MNLSNTFGFKGFILPVIGKNNQFYVFIQNKTESTILFNIVSNDFNKFYDVNSEKSKLIKIGDYSENRFVKIYIMGHELFGFYAKECHSSVLTEFSSYIFNNFKGLEEVSFDIKFHHEIEIYADSNIPQEFFVKIIDKTTNQIMYEDNYLTNETFIFNHNGKNNFNVKIFDKNGNIVCEKEN